MKKEIALYGSSTSNSTVLAGVSSSISNQSSLSTISLDPTHVCIEEHCECPLKVGEKVIVLYVEGDWAKILTKTGTEYYFPATYLRML